MGPDEKRARIDELIEAQNQKAESAVKKAISRAK